MAETMFKSGDYDVYMQGSGVYLPSQMIQYLSGAAPPRGVNSAGIDNKTYDAYAAKAQAMVPPAACDYWRKAEQALWDNLDLLPIADRPQAYYLSHGKAQFAGFNAPIPTSLRALK
jgi:peptide/nickel transport system substrate-binding protein